MRKWFGKTKSKESESPAAAAARPPEAEAKPDHHQAAGRKSAPSSKPVSATPSRQLSPGQQLKQHAHNQQPIPPHQAAHQQTHPPSVKGHNREPQYQEPVQSPGARSSASSPEGSEEDSQASVQTSSAAAGFGVARGVKLEQRESEASLASKRRNFLATTGPVWERGVTWFGVVGRAFTAEIPCEAAA